MRNLRFQIPNFKICANDNFKSRFHYVKKLDEGRENIAANTLRGTLLLKMAISWDSRKGPRTSSVEGSLPSSLANQWHRLQSLMDLNSIRRTPSHDHRLKSVPLRKRYFDCQKTKGAGFKPPREAARSFNSLDLALRFGSGSPLPLN